MLGRGEAMGLKSEGRFVISTEAQRSGETPVFWLSL